MRLLTNFSKFCFIMVLLSIVGLCVAQGNLQLLLVAGALAAISWYVTEGPRGRSLPRWVANVLVIGITLHVLFDLVQSGSDILESLSRFALWLTLIKLYERRTPRDHAQLMSLSFLLMLIASLQTFELLFGLILLTYAVLGLYVLVLYQLYAAHEQVRQERQAAIPDGARVRPSTKPIIGRSPTGQFRALVLGLGMTGFMLSVVAFIAFPRGLGEMAFGDAGRRGARGAAGFTDEVDLLHGTRINESRREVMRVQVLDEDGQPQRGPTAVLHLRGAVLEHYQGNGRWSKRDRPWQLHQFVDEQFRPIAPRQVNDLPEWTLRVDLVGETRTIFSTRRIISLKPDRPRSLKIQRMTGVITTESDVPAVRGYELKFDMAPMIFSGYSWRNATDRTWMSSLERLGDERIAELAEQILRQSGLQTEPPPFDDEEDWSTSDFWQWRRDAARAFERYLRSPPFRYSIDLSHIVRTSRDGAAEDPIAGFLFDHQRGHCEYFASAMMALCYNAGIESRMVTGYVAAAYDSESDRYNVMDLNAHAWVEVRTGNRQWHSFDPTPPQVLHELHSLETTRADKLRWIYDRFDMAWNRTVVRYDAQSQSRLAEQWEFGFGDRVEQATERVKLWLNDLNRMFRFKPATYLWLGLIGVIVILAVIVLVQLIQRLLALRGVLRLKHMHGRRYQRMLRQLGFYLDMLTVLERGGVTKPDWQPPMQFAESLARSHPDEAVIVRQITDAFYRARYGEQPLTPDELRELRAGVRTLAARLGVRW